MPAPSPGAVLNEPSRTAACVYHKQQACSSASVGCSKARTRRSRSFLRGVLVQFYLGRWLANVVHFYHDHHCCGLAAVGVCTAATPSVGLCVLVHARASSSGTVQIIRVCCRALCVHTVAVLWRTGQLCKAQANPARLSLCEPLQAAAILE